MAAAPILDIRASPKFTAIVENSGVPSGAVGTLVSALIDSGGSTWSDVGTVSNASALVLHADNNTRLAFVPAANYTGNISDLVTFKAWDRTGLESISSNPTLTGTLDTSGAAYDVTLSADGNTAFVADGASGLQIIDLGYQQHFSSNANTSSIDVLAAPTPTPSPTITPGPTPTPTPTEEVCYDQVQSIDDITTPDEVSTFQLKEPIEVGEQKVES